MGDGVLVSDENGNFILHNEALVRMAGPRINKSISETSLSSSSKFYKSDGITLYPVSEMPLSCALRGERINDEEVCVRRSGGPDRWLSVSATPLRDDQGRIIGGVTVSRDVTERRIAAEALRLSEAHHRQLAEHNRLLVQEVEHRVGNNLAGLLGLVSVMRGRTRDVDAFADAFEARLRGMAHVHQMLTDAGWKSLVLRDLIASALEAVRDSACYQTEEFFEGPQVEVAAKHVQPLTLILLELYTNSCKYGAHSVPDGKLHIEWNVHHNATGRKIRLHWRERGGPPIEAPVKPSLGTHLINAFAAKELKGRVEMNFPREGAEFLIEFPIPEIAVGSE
jgi:two-component sensor histidine kinase